ncbi:MAG: cysteine hydrolase [Ilumatobacteraceae bacterium]|nr:cysteine hydrolase [Ilumatobacteraceae bacterium]
MSGRFSPSTTAVVTMEMQRGICGDLAAFVALQEAVAHGVADQTGVLLDAARLHKYTIMHCIFSLRADRVGTRMDLPLMAAARKDPNYLLQSTDGVALLPQLHQATSDLVCERHHGVSPFTETDLDARLRDKGIDTLIVAGVSLNLGIVGLSIEAVNLGYTVVVATDAVAGFPAEYAQNVLRNTLAAITLQATVAQVVVALA